MDSGTSIAFQIVLRLVDDRVIAPDSASRRVLAATIARVGRDRGLLAFGAADTHIHVAALCDRINAGLLARSLEMALRTALALPVCFAAPSITRVSDQHHLKATFGYVQRNARRHGIADPDASEGSSLHDLLGMRTTSLWLGDRVRGALPRTTRGDLLDLLAMPGLGVVGPSARTSPMPRRRCSGCATAELVTATGIFNATNGDLVHSFSGVRRPVCSEIAVADIDLDGHDEILSDGTCWGSDGARRWVAELPPMPHATSVPVALNADADPEAEVAWVEAGRVTLVDTDGATLWSLETEETNISPARACATDVDGDAIDELVIETPSSLVALRFDGSTLWQIPVDEARTGGMTGCSFFDFDGDGREEMLYSDEHTFYLLDPATGATLYSLARLSATSLDIPIVADLDGDGAAEIVISVAGRWDDSPDSLTVTAYHHAGGNWPPAPPIWGSSTWSGTTLWADGEIRAGPSRPWQDPGFWRGQVAGPLGGRDLAVSIEDSCVSSCDDAVGTVSIAVQVSNHGPQDLRAGAMLTVSTGSGIVLQSIALDAVAVGWTMPIQVDVPVVDTRDGIVLSVDGDCTAVDDSVTWGLDACP